MMGVGVSEGELLVGGRREVSRRYDVCVYG